MSNTFYIYGPPGTGKTRYLARKAKELVQMYGQKSVLICSLTRAAAREIAGRDTQVDEGMIGTLHAHCRRALDNPEIAEKHIDEWNQANPSPRYQMTPNSGGEDRGGVEGQLDGDKLLAEINILRSKMIPLEEWRGETRVIFYTKWMAWQRAMGYTDFTGLIERAIEEVPKPPGSPQVMLGDEAQDWSKLEYKLFKEVWGANVQELFMAGDPDQALFTWRGADPHIFSGNPVPPENETVLDQSYRVPKKVHEHAVKWIEQIKDRKSVKYRHKEGVDGAVNIRPHDCYKDCYKLLEDVERQAKAGETCMILTSCSFMLWPLQKDLRAWGIPFHNPFRRGNHGWNPLHTSADRISMSERVRAFMQPDNDNEAKNNMDRWSKAAFQKWMMLLTTKGLLRHGTKKVVESGDFTVPDTIDKWGYFFKHEEDILPCLQLDLHWLRDHLKPSKKHSIEYPLKIISRGWEGSPKVIIGTIHSVKGGEADHVYVFPDIAKKSYDMDDHSDTIRMFYVAMTRAKKTLNLCLPSSKYTVDWGY